MNLTFFGTGSNMPTPQLPNKAFHSFAGFSVETGPDFLLFDIGPGTVTKMLQAGIDIQQKPSHLFISHFHLDHCLDFITLTKSRALRYKFTGQGKDTPLPVFGPTGLLVLSQNLFAGIEKWKYMSELLHEYDIIKLQEIMEGTVTETSKWKVTCSPIEHYGGVCYRLDAEGKSIVYSGDMGYDENISRLGKDADVAILECSYPDSSHKNKGLHLSPEDIGKLAKLGNFKHVILTHLYPECEGKEEEIMQTIKTIAQCDVTIAYDGFQMEL